MTAMATAQASGPPPKVVPCMPGVKARAASSVQSIAPMGMPFGDWLGQRRDVRHESRSAGRRTTRRCVPCRYWISSASSNAPVESQSSRAAAKNSWRDGVDAAFALHGLDADGADFVGELCAQIGDVVEADELDAGHDGRERFAILLLVGRCDGAHGAAVEAVFQREELRADLLALAIASRPAWARASFSAASQASVPLVAEEDAVQPADLGQPHREFGGVLVEEEVRGVQQALALRRDRRLNRGMRVAQRRYADAAQEIEVVVALLVAQIDAVPLDEE